MNEQINVALFGRAGYGKSSIANMLVQRDIYDNNNTFVINDGVRGEPINIYGYVTESYRVFDTVGLGEPPSHPTSHEEAVKKIRNYFSECQVPLNYIFYVHRKGRITEEDIKMFKIFKEIFEWGINKFIIIITHTNPEWVRKPENSNLIRRHFGNYPIIPVDFPFTEEEDEFDTAIRQRNKRAQSLQRLENELSELSYSGVEQEVLSSAQIFEKKVSRVVRVLPIAGSAYQLIASGVYYKLEKPNNAKERLKEGVFRVAIDSMCVVVVAVASLCAKIMRK
ncbi:hypothetical protein C1645_575783 [Glomus cerebriforme]|uniref:AIG1-type G domain-containing protein n=1 Tax=Glomus cerebriforme TaxID=658196 RepID=A0A397TD81_9GLOM|nr:hypothetical protein C1645_575783 [Glomus cerebriforme]